MSQDEKLDAIRLSVDNGGLEVKTFIGDGFKLYESDIHKEFLSDDYNFVFNKTNGYFCRWGTDEKEDPKFCHYGPEIFDMEISTICSQGCKFCYKSNTSKGSYMSFETFKKIFDKLPKTLTQIAFGIGDIDGNPDLWKILEYSRINGVIPNITINGYRMTPEYYDLLAKYCGGVAVSHYNNAICYNAVFELTTRGVQVNIHKMVAEETYEDCINLIEDACTDHRLSKMQAIVFLYLKQKGRGEKMNPLSKDKYKELIDYAMHCGVKFGMDSCSANLFISSVENPKQFIDYVEPCESGLFSGYCNAEGIMFPCSFMEEAGDWKEGINLTKIEDFLSEVWYNSKIVKWRNHLLSINRSCPIYKIGE